ncbi:MAG: ABC transporter ATP-binding protein [Pigmentiphaga sp.]|nr:ABC transporter ATP-binding protein [Pigmentiphaga sp.]
MTARSTQTAATLSGSPTLLAIDDLWAGYGEASIVRGVSASIATGEIATIIGPNGAGKSTLLRGIFGELHHHRGTLTFAGERIEHENWDRRQRRGIGFVPQGRCNFPGMVVRENLLMGTHMLPRAKRAAAIEHAIELFPMLGRRLKVPAGNLSGGEQQVLEMAMVLTQSPRLLLLDEPSLGLSPKTMGEVFDAVCHIRSHGVTVLIVEQNTAGAIAVSDTVWVLELGQLIASGPAADIAQDPRIRQAYLGG